MPSLGVELLSCWRPSSAPPAKTHLYLCARKTQTEKTMIEELNIPEIEIEGLDGIEIDIPLFENGFENRYKRVAKTGGEHPELLKYSNAEKLAKAIRLDKGARYDCIVSGNFIWGDFIEAFFTVNEAQSRSVTISTLSMDQNNVDSLKNLMVGGMSTSST